MSLVLENPTPPCYHSPKSQAAMKALAGQLHYIPAQINVHRAADHAIDLGLLCALLQS